MTPADHLDRVVGLDRPDHGRGRSREGAAAGGSPGRCGAPTRVIGDLLIALRKAVALAISPPVCVECGKKLRTLQPQGQARYCLVCGYASPPKRPCRNGGCEG